MDAVPLHLLQAFVAFNEAKNVTEAARMLGLSQPGLSKQLAQLERALPGKVFTMTGRKKTLTPYGRELHRRLKAEIAGITEAARAAWVVHADPAAAELRVVGRRGVLERMASRVHFAGSIHFSELSNEAVIEALLTQRAELGVAHSPPSSTELVAKPLFREEFRLVIPKRLHPTRPQLGGALVERLLGLPALGFKLEDEILTTILGSAPRLVRVSEDYRNLAAMADAGLGWTVVPRHIEVSPRWNWTLRLPAKGLPSRQFYLIYRRELSQLPWFRELVGEITACFAS